MIRPLWLNRATGCKPGWTTRQQHQSLNQWGNLEKLETRLAHGASFFRGLSIACFVFVAVGVIVSASIQLARFAGWLA